MDGKERKRYEVQEGCRYREWTLHLIDTFYWCFSRFCCLLWFKLSDFSFRCSAKYWLDPLHVSHSRAPGFRLCLKIPFRGSTLYLILYYKVFVQCTVYVHPLSFGLRHIMIVLISRCYSSAVQEVLLPLLPRTAKFSQLQHDVSSQTQNCQQHCVQSLQPN